jgi:HEAT repeat protein
MKIKQLRFSVWSLAIAIFVTASIAHADEEQDLVAILKSKASTTDKCDACQKLRLIGTAKSVAAIAPLLLQQPTAHAARYALEGMPCSEALVALRKAAAKTSGSNEIGLIDSLGWRRDAGSVSLLKKKLADKDAVIASTAATALGRIGGKKAVDALGSARNRADIQPALLDGLLRCADQFKVDGDVKSARKLYGDLENASSPTPIRQAAAHELATITSQPQ